MDWEDFVNEFMNHTINDDIIFRGQSNSTQNISPFNKDGKIISKKLIEWEIISSFNRHYDETSHYRFSTFISQQLQNDLFGLYYKHYEVLKRLPLNEMDTLNKLYLLQHYGCPTCLIDFTKDPLIALYFSITGIKGSSGSTLDANGDIAIYPDDCFLSLYKIDCKTLREIGVKNLKDDNDNLFLNYRNYELPLDNSLNSSNHAILAILNTPKFNEINYNLKKQEGCFLLYESYGFNFRGKGLEKFISEYANRRNLSVNSPAICIYRIRYNSIFGNRKKNKKSLFNFLSDNKTTGATLFNDLQGLKYDFNFFHQL